MTRFILPASLLLLAACSGGDDRSEPEDRATISPLQKADRTAPEAKVDADLPAQSDEKAPEPPEIESPAGGSVIPAGIRGRWALKAADCTAKRGTDLTALVIDATNLRFYESHGELARVRSSDAKQILADYEFSGEGQDWDQRVQLELADDGKILVRRDLGKGATGETMRYTRCA